MEGVTFSKKSIQGQHTAEPVQTAVDIKIGKTVNSMSAANTVTQM